jgi:multiple antibiotic resistance protein
MPNTEAATTFILFFVTLGPLKLLGPFCEQTQHLAPAELRKTSRLVFLISLCALIIGGLLGSFMAPKWNISVPAIVLAGGIIFFLVALQLVLAPYGSSARLPAEPIADTSMAAALRLTFPLVLTPYGLAAAIALLSADHSHIGRILTILVMVMVLDLLAMLYVRQIMRGVMLLILQILGAVLGVLQVCLAVQIIIRGLRELHVLAA